MAPLLDAGLIEKRVAVNPHLVRRKRWEAEEKLARGETLKPYHRVNLYRVTSKGREALRLA